MHKPSWQNAGHLLDYFDGSTTEIHVLERAGIERPPDIVLAVTGDDEDNLVIAQIAKEGYGVPKAIARVNDPRNQQHFDLLAQRVRVGEVRQPDRAPRHLVLIGGAYPPAGGADLRGAAAPPGAGVSRAASRGGVRRAAGPQWKQPGDARQAAGGEGGH